MRPRKNTKLISLPALLAVLVLMVVTQACSKKSTPPPPPTDQDASGLYSTGSIGTANFKVATDQILNEVKGMVYGTLPKQKFIFFDVATNVLIDGEITAISLTNITTGTAVVYKDGVMVDNDIAVTGTVTSRSTVNLTLLPNTITTDFAGGSISAVFILPTSNYDQAASIDRILSDTSPGNPDFNGSLSMAFTGMATTNFEVGANKVYGSVSIRTQPSLIRCDHLGTVTTGNTKNVYVLSEVITTTTNCTITNSPDYSGFASVLNGTGTNDVLWYAVTNGTNSIFSILTN